MKSIVRNQTNDFGLFMFPLWSDFYEYSKYVDQILYLGSLAIFAVAANMLKFAAKMSISLVHVALVSYRISNRKSISMSTITDSCLVFLPFRRETDPDFGIGCRCGKSKAILSDFEVNQVWRFSNKVIDY